MLVKAFDKKILFGTTVIAGFAALSVVGGSAYAQTNPVPPATATPAPAVDAPPQTAPDPAVVEANSDDQMVNGDLETQPGLGEAAEVEAVVVTGSRIRRDPTNAPTPLIQLGREELLQSGQPNIVDFLADVPALSGSVVPEDTTGSGLNDGGLSLLNLRDLGAVRTLVLVDGRRHVGSSPGTLSVDVDTIPSLLIENIEVVTGGQSALYGADAVSGVVNFILRRNFEGIEIDGTVGQINEEGGALNKRISGLIGKNFLDDRLNVYAFGEYQQSDEVLDLDIDWKRESYALQGVDADVNAATADNEIDTVFLRDRRDALGTRGGLLVLFNQPTPTRSSDPDTPRQLCGAVPANPARDINSIFRTNCQAIRVDQLGKTFVFNADGTARPFNFGTFQPDTGFSRRTNVGGDGLNSGTEFGQGSRLPESEAMRFQTGLNFNLTENDQFFAEAKYVKEETFDTGQPTFWDVGLVPFTAVPDPFAGRDADILAFNGRNLFYNDNAFLPQNVKDAISANTRPLTCTVPTATTGGTCGPLVNDPRAYFFHFGPSRSQFNERELQRYVVGLRGDRDQLGFINNFSYEIGFTHGVVEARNDENAVDQERYLFAMDAVRDVNNVTGKGANSIVCRVQLLTANGATTPDQFRGGTLNASSPQVAGCVPINIFGSDFRSDANEENITGGGGRPGLTPEQAAYVIAGTFVTNRNEQNNFLSFASGEILEGFLPAGPIGIAVGYEYREEKTSGTGRDGPIGDRFIFTNRGPDFPEASYEANEIFAEVRIPLLKDVRFAEDAEISGAYRKSDYTTVGEVETYSVNATYRPTRDVLFRATYGQATRIPNLGENFAPPSQTFLNNFTDPCDALALNNVADPVLRANRTANCQALLGPNYDPATTRIEYTSGIPGNNQGNPFLVPEESRSYTLGFAFTPRFARGLSITADYYDIKITNVISTVSAATAANQCVSGEGGLNTNACNTIFRDPTTFRIIDFIQGSLNFAATEAKGVDFTARYGIDTADILGGRDLGRLDYSLRGNYLIRQEDFVNIANPGDASEFDSQVGLPRVRFLSTLTYTPIDRLSISWNWDWQASQEIVDSDFFLQNTDNRLVEFAETGAYSTHDFSLRYEALDNVVIRAGVVNAFDNDPPYQLGSTTAADNFDFFGRRFYVGANVRFGAAVR